MRYRKKPVVIEAFQLTAERRQSMDEWPEWLKAAAEKECEETGSVYSVAGSVVINTLEGNLIAAVDDWIIQGVNGELYPCKPDIFEKTYESAGEETVSLHPGFENADDSWIQGPVQCAYCGRGWTAVRPTSICGGLECPDCGKMGGFPGVQWDRQVPS